MFWTLCVVSKIYLLMYYVITRFDKWCNIIIFSHLHNFKSILRAKNHFFLEKSCLQGHEGKFLFQEVWQLIRYTCWIEAAQTIVCCFIELNFFCVENIWHCFTMLNLLYSASEACNATRFKRVSRKR